MADLVGSPFSRHFMEYWQSSVTVRMATVSCSCCSSVHSALKNLMHESLLQISESFHCNFMIKHKDVSDFILLLRESPFFNASCQSFFTTIQSCGLHLIHGILYFQDSLTLTKASFSLATKSVQEW